MSTYKFQRQVPREVAAHACQDKVRFSGTYLPWGYVAVPPIADRNTWHDLYRLKAPKYCYIAWSANFNCSGLNNLCLVFLVAQGWVGYILHSQPRSKTIELFYSARHPAVYGILANL